MLHVFISAFCSVRLLNVLVVCVLFPGPAMGGGEVVVTPAEMELHNDAGGSWTIISGKVYDLEMAEVGGDNCCCCCCCCLRICLLSCTLTLPYTHLSYVRIL